jgi:ABC-type Na+ efflux pump permease subunit
VDSAGGRTWLAQPAIDVFVDGTQVLKRDDNKSLFAAGALQRYLQKYETARVSAEFDLGRAFPLRVESNYFGSTDTTTAPSNSDAAVREQIREAESGALPQIKSVTDKQIVVPSLTAPPGPFGQVVLAFIYIMPVFLVSVFFTSGFMDEKTNRKLTMLLSAPITPFQIIVGKMLPYVTFSLIGVIVISVLTHGDSPRALLIFTPAVLFIFGIYLMVPMLYHTFKDTTFVSMLATAVTTAYLIVPAMFSGISDLAYISPITLAV